ncbi:MAG: FliH/SctL family protein [Beijerinckiaceae bacterium]|nr:FliH/SctL family protein [Beijerinckiaceae bacterium]MCZ8300638.1 FliH/SctL family protein [Beijerinckiaceae bacterium]
MSTARSAFTFGRDFTKAGSGLPFIEPGQRVPVPYPDHVRLVEEARQAAYQQGIEEGRRMQADHEQIRIANGLEAINARLEIATIEMRRLEETARSEALAFAMLFARKIAGRLIDTAPVGAIEATARAIFNDLRGSPHVAVRVAPDLVDPCKERLMGLLKENGIESRLFVFPDPEIALGDCRIEWSDGGIVRDRNRLENLVETSAKMLFPDAGDGN